MNNPEPPVDSQPYSVSKRIPKTTAAISLGLENVHLGGCRFQAFNAHNITGAQYRTSSHTSARVTIAVHNHAYHPLFLPYQYTATILWHPQRPWQSLRPPLRVNFGQTSMEIRVRPCSWLSQDAQTISNVMLQSRCACHRYSKLLGRQSTGKKIVKPANGNKTNTKSRGEGRGEKITS